MLTRKFRKTYITQSDGFGIMCRALLSQIPAGKLVASLVFYGNPLDIQEYSVQRNILNDILCSEYPDGVPPYSFIAQKPLLGGLNLEVCLFEEMAGQRISYHQFSGIRYLTIQTAECRELIMGGSVPDDLTEGTFQQAWSAFQKIGSIFRREKMPVNSIIRQWNYIGDITGTSSGEQNYHQFNLARSHFYDLAQWDSGYPAATGIGIKTGGVMVRIEALLSASPSIRNIAINNVLQVPAHQYSAEVLAGNENILSTPKFERARLLGTGDYETVFVSGTAAIRGEQSMAPGDAAEQTRITLENIFSLFPGMVNPVFEVFIIYLKREEDFTVVKGIVEKTIPEVSPVYLLAGLCRDELLVEMEGVCQG
jgi:hypothetical protein